MITAAQIRSARAALRWPVTKLAESAGVGVQTIKRFEASDGVPPSRSSTLMEIKRAFERAGVEFIGTPEKGPGVRLWRSATNPQEIQEDMKD